MYKLKIILLNIFFVLVFFPAFVRAQADDWGWLLTFTVDFSIFLERLAIIIISLAFIFFLWGLAVFILNADNEEKRKEGKKKIFWGIIALTVMIGIWGIVEFLLSSFGITESGVDLPEFPTNLP